MDFEWNPAKDEANLRKHGISFVDAATVFSDPLSYTFDDPDHAQHEHRWLTLGRTQSGRLLIVSHTERNRRIRIISAREATKYERKIYEEG